MATLTIPDSTYQRLIEMAAAQRLPLDQLLAQVAVAAIGNPPLIAKRGAAEWITEFDAWLASHPRRAFIADDSRDVIYGDERD